PESAHLRVAQYCPARCANIKRKIGKTELQCALRRTLSRVAPTTEVKLPLHHELRVAPQQAARCAGHRK
ncbi:hypothetical protein A2U01_0111888, partial [Trifolium medium]|nr:hypothetical protein [Trifolium medium]